MPLTATDPAACCSCKGLREVNKPVLQALVLAEHVYTDQAGKKIICGTFNVLALRCQGPLSELVERPDGTRVRRVAGGGAGPPWFYLSLTDVWDGTRLLLQFVSLKRNEVLFETEIVLECDDRLKTIEIVSPLPPLTVPEPGTYAFEIVCEGEIIGSHRIQARMTDDSEPNETRDESDAGEN